MLSSIFIRTQIVFVLLTQVFSTSSTNFIKKYLLIEYDTLNSVPSKAQRSRTQNTELIGKSIDYGEQKPLNGFKEDMSHVQGYNKGYFGEFSHKEPGAITDTLFAGLYKFCILYSSRGSYIYIYIYIFELTI